MMKKIKSTLSQHEILGNEIATLRTEQVQLNADLPALTAAVAGGDAKQIAPLSIKKSRLEILPGLITAKESERGSLVEELRGLHSTLAAPVAAKHSEIYHAAEARIRDFLTAELGDNDYLIGNICREIVNNHPQVNQSDAIKNQFVAPSLNPNLTPDAIVSRARRAVATLEKYL